MPKAAPYRLNWLSELGIYALHDELHPEQTLPVTPGSQEWFAWLANIPSFTFSGQHGQLTVRRESRSGKRAYWYAYHRVGVWVRERGEKPIVQDQTIFQKMGLSVEDKIRNRIRNFSDII